MRRPIIAGNWKMNNTKAQTYALLNDLIPLVKDAEAEVVICVPYTSIWAAGEAIKGTNIHLGAENVHWAEKGAFTGEISADMLKEQGVEYVIIGHSERRQYFGETDQTVNMRVKAALAHGLKPIICVGETLEERESGKVEDRQDRYRSGRQRYDSHHSQHHGKTLLRKVRGREGAYPIRRLYEPQERQRTYGYASDRRRTYRRSFFEGGRLLSSCEV